MKPTNKQKSLFAPGQQRIWIKDLQVGARIDTFFKVLKVDKKIKKDGGAYLTLTVMDKTGKIEAKVWNSAELYYKSITEGGYFRINGQVNEFMSRKELKVDYVRALSQSDSDFNEADFIEQAAFDTEKVFVQMTELLETHLTTPCLKRLLEKFITQYGEPFKTHYGAQKIHHGYLGGLLEHTFSMMQLSLFCAQHYKLDKELLLIGVLFHDMGKMYEFAIEPTLNTTLEGGLLGHLMIGTRKFLELKADIPDFPEELSIKIQHLIISHHGEKEYGSPEIPKIPEAFVLHIVDLLDSKLQIVKEAISNSESKGLYTDYIRVLGRHILMPGKEEQ